MILPPCSVARKQPVPRCPILIVCSRATSVDAVVISLGVFPRKPELLTMLLEREKEREWREEEREWGKEERE